MPEQLDITDISELPPDDDSGGNDEIDVLEWVNAKRKERSLPPIEKLPLGLPGHSYYCPIAIALDGDVGAVSAYGGSIKLPESVKTFIKEYDEGAYPELVSEDLMRVLGMERVVVVD